MSDDLSAFKADLREAGQPWNRWGVRLAFAGVLCMLVAQVALTRWSVIPMVVGLGLVVVGWGFLIVAYLRRARWAKAHTPQVPPLPDPGGR